VEEELLLHVALPAAALLPELAGLEDRELDFSRRAVHLLAHDRLSLAVGTQAERVSGDTPRRIIPARKQDVRDRVGVAGDLADGLEVSGPAWGRRGC
jgi:hypothetical protein